MYKRQAAEGRVIVIIDVIDFSTTAEAAIEAGALAVLGAAPDKAMPPVAVNPFGMGVLAGQLAQEHQTDVILVSEPRIGKRDSQLATAQHAVQGITSVGASIGAVLPNIGAEISKLDNILNRVVLAVTGTGGVAFDAAIKAKAPAVVTATVARTRKQKGAMPALTGARRAVETAKKYQAGIALVAASGNSMEDILAAKYIYGLVLERFR